MFRYALRNLLQNKMRLVISVGGVALALSLILALDAIMTGVEGRLTAYIDHSGADVFVSQAGVRNLHMVSSWLPASVVGEVQAVPGVAAVTPIMYLTSTMEVGPYQDQYSGYVIGLPQGATMGGPWRIAQGVSIPAEGQTVIDRGVAEQYAQLGGFHLHGRLYTPTRKHADGQCNIHQRNDAHYQLCTRESHTGGFA